MNKFLVTGGAGFIGSHLVKRLLDDKNEVIVIDDFNDYYSPEIKKNNIKDFLHNKNFKLFKTDIRDNLENVFKNNKIEMVIHLAARAGVRPSLKDPVLYNSVNVLGTTNLLECCKKYNINKFLFASSSSVYGLNSKLPFNEEDPLEKPISPYAVSKIAGENLCKVYKESFGVSCIALRFFTVYGPKQRPEMAIHKFVKLIKEGKPIPFYGDGGSSRDYTFISDILDGIIACIKLLFKNDNKIYEIFNLGDSNAITLKQLVGIIEEVVGEKAILQNLSDQQGDVPITFADISKAVKMLGYKPQVEIKQGIKEFVRWYNNEL